MEEYENDNLSNTAPPFRPNQSKGFPFWNFWKGNKFLEYLRFGIVKMLICWFSKQCWIIKYIN